MLVEVVNVGGAMGGPSFVLADEGGGGSFSTALGGWKNDCRPRDCGTRSSFMPHSSQ
jgi:hypothetical protein